MKKYNSAIALISFTAIQKTFQLKVHNALKQKVVSINIFRLNQSLFGKTNHSSYKQSERKSHLYFIYIVDR